MKLRKITSDSSVRYVSKDGHSHSEQIAKERKENAFNNKLSQKNKELLKNITREGFRIIK